MQPAVEEIPCSKKLSKRPAKDTPKVSKDAQQRTTMLRDNEKTEDQGRETMPAEKDILEDHP